LRKIEPRQIGAEIQMVAAVGRPEGYVFGPQALQGVLVEKLMEFAEIGGLQPAGKK
jgi:hypothetical protein